MFNTHPLLANYCNETLFLDSLPLIMGMSGMASGSSGNTTDTDMTDNMTAVDGGNGTEAMLAG